ncbi:ATP-binding protein [Streptomyces sp. FH025]|uniref:ATP-binding protein n=1 Tax=Streptomyces sp. FH025 TaxID=2815937 RepID=UPI001A9FD81A|nr:ATP-binding protein [Streptomyces sp. FH025]MBO1413509.1 ATP-binding protein [Streptomyces sp. FH025]
MTPLNTVMVLVLCQWDVEADVAAVPLARHKVTQIVRSWGIPMSDDSMRDAELCAGELLANAIEYAQGRFRIVVRWTGVRLRVEVADRNPQPPARNKADDMATGGRGLLLVEALAHSWGWYPVEAGKVVWFEVAPDESVMGDARLAALVFVAQAGAQQSGLNLGDKPKAQVVP